MKEFPEFPVEGTMPLEDDDDLDNLITQRWQEMVENPDDAAWRFMARPQLPHGFLVPLTTDTATVAELRLHLRFYQDTFIDVACRAATDIAERTRSVVTFEFNGHLISAAPGISSSDVEAIYWSRMGEIDAGDSSLHIRLRSAPP
jgi:hypothetical protein